MISQPTEYALRSIVLVKVLFVCLGNICRSPAAEGVFRSLVDHEGLDGSIHCDSAGTGAWHIGSPPDSRMISAARNRDVDLNPLRARKAASADFGRFDYVLAMDQDNLDELSRICPPEFQGRLCKFLDFAPALDHREVPDPYYGGPHGFELVLDLIEAASEGLIADIRENHL